MLNIHVIDGDVYRRNQMAKAIIAAGRHAEIYENYTEFENHGPRDGLLLIAEAVGKDVLKALTQGRCQMPTVLYASSLRVSDIKIALRAGFVDVLAWPSQGDDLGPWLEAISIECEGRNAVVAQISAAKRAVADLSRREAEVLSALVSGASNKVMATELGISPRTIEIHRANVLRKLGARSTADAVRIGIYAGLVPQISVSAV